MAISLIPGLHCQVFESVRILGNSYCYHQSEIYIYIYIGQEDVGMVKLLQ